MRKVHNHLAVGKPAILNCVVLPITVRSFVVLLITQVINLIYPFIISLRISIDWQKHDFHLLIVRNYRDIAYFLIDIRENKIGVSVISESAGGWVVGGEEGRERDASCFEFSAYIFALPSTHFSSINDVLIINLSLICVALLIRIIHISVRVCVYLYTQYLFEEFRKYRLKRM